jgi:hypothetical protein
MAEKSGFEALKTGSALLKLEAQVSLYRSHLEKQKFKNSDSHVMWYFCRAPGVSFYGYLN